MNAIPFIQQIKGIEIPLDNPLPSIMVMNKLLLLYETEFKFNLLECQDWLPAESDKDMMGEKSYNEQVESFNKNQDNVLFKNVKVKWDSCDCEYSCSHERWVYELKIGDFVFELVDDNEYATSGLSTHMPKTIGEFIDDCYRSGILLEWSDKVVEKYFS